MQGHPHPRRHLYWLACGFTVAALVAVGPVGGLVGWAGDAWRWDGLTAGTAFNATYAGATYVDEGGFIDLDGDGVEELLVPGEDPRVLHAFRDGELLWNHTAFGEWHIYNPHAGMLPVVADLDEDGLTELVVPNRDGFLRVLDPLDGSEWWAIDLVQVPLFAPLAVADLDGTKDGLEILTYHEPTAAQPYLDAWDAKGRLIWRIDWTEYASAGQNDHPMTLVDVDGDGALDLFVSAQRPYRIDAATGEVVWSRDACGIEAAVGKDRRGHWHVCMTPEGDLVVADAITGVDVWSIEDLGIQPVALRVADVNGDRTADIVAVSPECSVVLVDGSQRRVAWETKLDHKGCQQVPLLLEDAGETFLALGRHVVDAASGRVLADLAEDGNMPASSIRDTGRMDAIQADGDAAVELFTTAIRGGLWAGRDSDYVPPAPFGGVCAADCEPRERPKVGNTSKELRDDPPTQEDPCIDNCDATDPAGGGGSGGAGGGTGGDTGNPGGGDEGSGSGDGRSTRRVGRDTTGNAVTCPEELTLEECDALFGEGWNEPEPRTAWQVTIDTVLAHPWFFGLFVIVAVGAIVQWRRRYY